ncbi:hypothetical protein CCACVL1_21907 [Corchorus capsularis]|uniref:Uncharacterized protein n=1 Tax=Corchorus capsularis TaxID=210143 RepID=A0A1R3H1W6_COCAP|nr:hypothetical protein CCACVL1_21907 [Corchorus capsularis]
MASAVGQKQRNGNGKCNPSDCNMA